MAAATNTVTPPDITGTVNQQFFIEPQGGPRAVREYLEHFPDAIYNKSPESNLVALMYALLGPAGLGTLKKNYLEARLAIEDNGLRTTDLDALYANPFSFARLATETYEEDTEGLLTQSQWEQIQRSDRSYHNRAINYLKALRAGGTLRGITLAAKSGLDRAVEVIENYRYLYDQHSDDPLGLEYFGVTRSTEEAILLPRQELPRSSVQVLSVRGDAIEGNFKLAFPFGPGETFTNISPTNPATHTLAYNSTFDQIQAALEELSGIGPQNVVVTGGPFPGNPISVAFTNELADRVIPELLVVENALVDNRFKQCIIEITQEQVGVSADGDVSTIPPEGWYFAEVAIGNIKPVTTIVSPGKAPSITRRQIANTTVSDSEFESVLRYVTGSRSVNWPELDPTHWIESGIEHEAPTLISGQQAHYSNFHNIHHIAAFTEEQEQEPTYEMEQPSGDEHIGPFSQAQRLLYPFLAQYTNTQQQFYAVNAAANPPSPQTFQEHDLIEGSYPSDYATLPGALTASPPESAKTPIWASKERTEGSDFLEVHLGSVQAVNFVSFEVSRKPYDIALAYDLLDDFPVERRFFPVTYVADRQAPSVLSIGHAFESPNPWSLVQIYFTNALGGMIYTPFIRIEFTKRTGEGSPFTQIDGTLLPYSIEVRNLRVGRNIS